MQNLNELIVLIKGAGEVASAIAHRLFRAHFKVVLTEIEKPLAVSRGTCYCEAVWDGDKTIEGITARLVPNTLEDIKNAWTNGTIPMLIDPEASIRESLKPDVFIDATMMKQKSAENIINYAPLVIGLGPGFCAGRDVHMVVETYQDNNLGRVILIGEALPNTGLPVEIGGLDKERVIWADSRGMFKTNKELGEMVESGETIGYLGKQELKAPLKGFLRGLIRSHVTVNKGAKLIEVDHINDPAIVNDIRNKMRAISGGVLEAIMLRFNV
jgi:xanthine dehydrogenase accessory factor